MSESAVAIVGSGVVGAAVAHALVQRGHQVTIFEKGPDFPYPHLQQFRDTVLYLRPGNPAFTLPPDLKYAELGGDYARHRLDIDHERGMVVGGSSTHWGAVALRMHPADFKTKSRYGYGEDWPLTYDELETYYGQAETFLGVSGTDDDNPFAPPRSAPFPLPPFELAHDDLLLAARLKESGISIHTTPQARTRLPFDSRPGCLNFGVCATCPIGVRYSPNHHLTRLVESGKCTLRSRVSARRVLLDAQGRARGLVIRDNDGARDEEHAAGLVVVAGGAIENARLLLLSADERHPDGVGNHSGHVGQNLVFHHYYNTELEFAEALFPGRVGPQTGQSQQFLEPSGRGKHGGIKIDFHSWPAQANPWERTSGAEVLADFERMKRTRILGIHAESAPSPQKYVKLSSKRDRFGDRFAHVHYQSSDFDLETWRYGRTLFDRFLRATGATGGRYEEDPSLYDSGAHHMGTCRMADSEARGVVDPFGQVHGCPRLYVLGGSSFAGASGALHPTLTMVALALRAAERMAELL